MPNLFLFATFAAGGLQQRMVQDETYFFGVIRFVHSAVWSKHCCLIYSIFWNSTKMNELTSEITKLRTEISTHEQDNSTYMTYEKRAEALAKEIRVRLHSLLALFVARER